MKSYILLPFLIIVLSGCKSLLSSHTAEWPWKVSENICQSVCNSSEALDAINAASKFCREVQNYYENGGQRTNNAKLAVGGIGTIAGTVVAPVSGGSAAAAWAGLSGAANAFQLSIDEAFSSNLAIKRRKEVQKAFIEGSNKIIDADASDYNKKVELAIKMATACAMGSAIADQAVMKAVIEE